MLHYKDLFAMETLDMGMFVNLSGDFFGHWSSILLYIRSASLKNMAFNMIFINNGHSC